jgi:L,D-peptidoglycan transpeptidase YkuD (ErfK/YbiS/YcfS/YnhG family)
LVAIVALVLTACGSAQHEATRPPASTTSSPTTSSTTATFTTATSLATPVTGSPTTVPRPSSTTTTPNNGASGRQVVVVRAARAGATTATLTAYEGEGPDRRVVFGPWTANVGRAGIAASGAKREGDGRTPSGSYGFDFMFGVDPDPDVRFPFRRVTGANIVWDDDPASAHYNQWVDTTTGDAGADPEPMYVRPQYNLGAVIAYNPERTPGLGSAIFLHVSAGRPTAGCVALPSAQLRQQLLWLDPTRSPVIVIS